jgi:hypothetical protein
MAVQFSTAANASATPHGTTNPRHSSDDDTIIAACETARGFSGRTIHQPWLKPRPNRAPSDQRLDAQPKLSTENSIAVYAGHNRLPASKTGRAEPDAATKLMLRGS